MIAHATVICTSIGGRFMPAPPNALCAAVEIPANGKPITMIRRNIVPGAASSGSWKNIDTMATGRGTYS